MSMRGVLSAALVLVAVLGLATTGSAASAGGAPLRTYKVTLENLTDGQPFSPGVAATHRPSIHVFEVGEAASPGIEAIAEDGNETTAVNALNASSHVTDVFDLNHPLTPSGTVVGSFTDSVSFEIAARPGDRLSLATMLICTNDGFTGLDGARLPQHGSRTFFLNGYDAGTENNTEKSADIVDACSALGPVSLAGDPNGNQNAAVDTSPHGPIHHHPGILGGGDLTPGEHDWTNPVAKVTVERVD